MIAADTGRPLVQHVVDRVRQCKNVRNVIVATDDQRIVEAVKPFGTIATMTSPDHPSGTDRIWQVVREWPGELVVNVQGDEPEIEPGIVDGLIARLQETRDDMATCATPFPPGADANDPNLVKVVTDLAGRAMYFSRAPIPFWRDRNVERADAHPPTYYLHLGIYAYRRDFLLQYAAWPSTACEQAEKLEQLRALEHGRSIYVLKVDRATHGIDTPEQYAEFVKRFELRSRQ